MATATLASILDQGELNTIGDVFAKAKIGTMLAAGGSRLMHEQVPVATNAATPTFPIVQLLSAKVSGGSAGNGLKTAVSNGGVAIRQVRETVAVASAAATPTFPILQLQYCKTIGTGAAGVKICDINGGTPGTGEAAPNAGGTSVVFNAETTGTGTVDLVYLTAGGTATPNAGGTSVAFAASEVTGASAVVDLYYLTNSTPLDANGVAVPSLTDTAAGLY